MARTRTIRRFDGLLCRQQYSESTGTWTTINCYPGSGSVGNPTQPTPPRSNARHFGVDAENAGTDADGMLAFSGGGNLRMSDENDFQLSGGGNLQVPEDLLEQVAEGGDLNASGEYDKHGGYYDEAGVYHDEFGGYYENGVYYDEDGNSVDLNTGASSTASQDTGSYEQPDAGYQDPYAGQQQTPYVQLPYSHPYATSQPPVLQTDPATGQPPVLQTDPATGQPLPPTPSVTNPQVGAPYQTDTNTGDPNAVYPAEGSSIMYISPRVSGGIVTDMNKIEVRIPSGVFTDGDIVLLNHPGYPKDYYVVEGNWDAKDGGGSAFIDIPYDDSTKERNKAPYQMNPIDHRKGTVEIVGTVNDPALMESSADGEFNNACGYSDIDAGFTYADAAFNYATARRPLPKPKTPVKPKPKTPVKPKPKPRGVAGLRFRGRPVKGKFLTKVAAARRKTDAAKGKKMGLKGVALRKFIRK